MAEATVETFVETSGPPKEAELKAAETAELKAAETAGQRGRKAELAAAAGGPSSKASGPKRLGGLGGAGAGRGLEEVAGAAARLRERALGALDLMGPEVNKESLSKVAKLLQSYAEEALEQMAEPPGPQPTPATRGLPGRHTRRRSLERQALKEGEGPVKASGSGAAVGGGGAGVPRRQLRTRFFKDEPKEDKPKDEDKPKEEDKPKDEDKRKVYKDPRNLRPRF